MKHNFQPEFLLDAIPSLLKLRSIPLPAALRRIVPDSLQASRASAAKGGAKGHTAAMMEAAGCLEGVAQLATFVERAAMVK
jgi:hypothetical protein